jgi:hypothetical protein
MDKEEFENALIKLDWTDKEASQYIGVTERAIKNYLKGERSISNLLSNFLLLHIKLKERNIVLDGPTRKIK